MYVLKETRPWQNAHSKRFIKGVQLAVEDKNAALVVCKVLSGCVGGGCVSDQ